MKKLALAAMWFTVTLSAPACAVVAPAPTAAPTPSSRSMPTNSPAPSATPTRLPVNVSNVVKRLNAHGYDFVWDNQLQAAIDVRDNLGLLLYGDGDRMSGELSSVGVAFGLGSSDVVLKAGDDFRALATVVGFPGSLQPLAGQVLVDGTDEWTSGGSSTYSKVIQGWVVQVTWKNGLLFWTVGRGIHHFSLQQ